MLLGTSPETLLSYEACCSTLSNKETQTLHKVAAAYVENSSETLLPPSVRLLTGMALGSFAM